MYRQTRRLRRSYRSLSIQQGRHGQTHKEARLYHNSSRSYYSICFDFFFLRNVQTHSENQTVGQYLSRIRAGNDYKKPLRQWAGFNGMAFDLGVNPPYKDKDVKRIIHEIDKTFVCPCAHMEYMPESMVPRTARTVSVFGS